MYGRGAGWEEMGGIEGDWWEREGESEGEDRMQKGKRHTPLHKTLLVNDKLLHAISQFALFLQTFCHLIKVYFDVERL